MAEQFRKTIIVCVMLLGVLASSCDNLINETQEQNQIKITGLSKYSGNYAMLGIWSRTTGYPIAVTDVVKIEVDGIINSALWKYDEVNASWTGSGIYWATLVIGDYSGYTTYYTGTISSVSINNGTTTVKFNRTVGFDSKGGTEINPINDVLLGEKIIKPADPVKSDFSFSSWYSDENNQNEWNFAIDTVNSDTILYAKWVPILKYYVSFESNSGNEIDQLNEIVSGNKIQKPTDPIKSGYIFKGWYKDSDCIYLWDFDVDTVTSNLTLYAKWRFIEATPPSEAENIGQSFDWAHNIAINWSEPSEDDFSYIKFYENNIFKADIQKGTTSYTVSSYEASTITIKTVDDLDNISNGLVYNLDWKEPGITRIIVKNTTDIPVSGANVIGFAANKTIKSATSDSRGAVFLNYSGAQAITILIAHTSFEGIIKDVNTSENHVVNFVNTNKGSIIASSGTCYVPGLSGRLNPIKDTLNRTYLYADNIAINGGLQQPVYFNLVNSLTLEDANGTVKQIWIPFIDGNTSLINYLPK